MNPKKTAKASVDGQLHRCLSILHKMQAGPVHVGHLAAGFGVGVRSIQRDLAALWAAGFDVKRTARGTYALAEGRL